MKACSVTDCDKPSARGRMCSMHASRLYKTGTTDAPQPRPTLLERLMAKVERAVGPLDCWEWTGFKNKLGYGRFYVDRANGIRQAHRVSYELHVGPIPDGLVIDHLCRNPGCVNPGHLEPVTNAENVRRGDNSDVTRQRHRERRTCAQGHPLFGDNVRIVKRDGARACRECARAANRRYRQKRRATMTEGSA